MHFYDYILYDKSCTCLFENMNHEEFSTESFPKQTNPGGTYFLEIVWLKPFPQNDTF